VALALAPIVYTAFRVVVPWERADCYSASSYVLAHRRPTDAVAGNHWEYLYYFRHLGPALSETWPPQQPGVRLWVALSGPPPEQRRQLAAGIPGNWATLEQREFARTTVFLLERCDSAPQSRSRRGRQDGAP
jgi:hypothetical protein